MINSAKKTLSEIFVQHLQSVFDGKPWFGKNISLILKNHPELPERALSILLHMIAWRAFVNAALRGEKFKIELNSEADWPDVTQSSADIMKDLRGIQKELIEGIQLFDESKWLSPLPGESYTYYQLVEGIIDHDLYHVGQIALLAKS